MMIYGDTMMVRFWQWAMCYGLVLWWSAAFAQEGEISYEPDSLYNPTQLQSDFIILRWALEKAHPGLYWYTPKHQLDSLFEAGLARLDKPMKEREFYQIVAPIIAAIHCGHTILDPSYRFQDLGTRFPLDVRFTREGRGFVGANYSADSSIARGTEILSINGVKMPHIVERMMHGISADATHAQGKWESLESDFQNYYDLWWGRPDTFALELLHPDTQQAYTVRVPAVDSDFLRMYDKLYYREIASKKVLDFEIIDSLNTGILTIHSFLPMDIKAARHQKFPKYLKKVFRTLQNSTATDLIIDLRQNSGGEMLYANLLYSYIAQGPYKFLTKIEVSNDQQLTQLKNSELATTAIHNPRYVMRTDSGTYEVKESHYDFLKVQQPQPRTWEGRVWVLTSKRTFSAASMFAAVVYKYQRGKIVGEETSGSAQGLCGGSFVNLKLPATNLLIEIPIEKWVHTIPDYPYKARGVIPHYLVYPSVEDLTKGIDRLLPYTLQLIKGEQDK